MGDEDKGSLCRHNRDWVIDYPGVRMLGVNDSVSTSLKMVTLKVEDSIKGRKLEVRYQGDGGRIYLL